MNVTPACVSVSQVNMTWKFQHCVRNCKQNYTFIPTIWGARAHSQDSSNDDQKDAYFSDTHGYQPNKITSEFGGYNMHMGVTYSRNSYRHPGAIITAIHFCRWPCVRNSINSLG